MKRSDGRPISKHTINLYAGDYPKLQRMYPSRLGAAKVIRELVHSYLRRIEENAAQRLPLMEALDIDLTTEVEENHV